ncbi:MAG: hypothetical protein ABJG47_13940 [Ekhidna sp.]
MPDHKNLDDLSHLSDSELNKMKIELEVQKLSQELKSIKSSTRRGWIAIIISIITIVSGFVGIYRSYHSIRTQNEQIRKAEERERKAELEFTYNGAMNTVLSSKNGRLLGLKMLQYFDHNALPLLGYLLEETNDTNEKKLIIEIIKKTYRIQNDTIKKQNIYLTLRDSFKESFGSGSFKSYLELFDSWEYDSKSQKCEIVSLAETMKDECTKLISEDLSLRMKFVTVHVDLKKFIHKHNICDGTLTVTSTLP